LGSGLTEVKEENVQCLGKDGTTILKGRTNCWAYWLQGQQIENIDQFVWLT
jgi:hypothetical protein